MTTPKSKSKFDVGFSLEKRFPAISKNVKKLLKRLLTALSVIIDKSGHLFRNIGKCIGFQNRVTTLQNMLS